MISNFHGIIKLSVIAWCENNWYIGNRQENFQFHSNKEGKTRKTYPHQKKKSLKSAVNNVCTSIPFGSLHFEIFFINLFKDLTRDYSCIL